MKPTSLSLSFALIAKTNANSAAMNTLYKENDMLLFLSENDKCAVEAISELIQNGGVAAVPTETVYGLVCAWDNAEAREKIYAIKNRPHDKRLQMLAPDIATAVKAGLLPDARLERLATKFWPGPLTVVAKADGNGVNGDSIGLRIPAHPFIMKLLKALGTPLASTSANISGCPPCMTAQDVFKMIDDAPASPNALIAGESNSETGGQASTVISLIGDSPALLREGPISLQEILDAIR